MQILNLKAHHKPIREYYQSVGNAIATGDDYELNVRRSFVNLLLSCCTQFNWQLVEEKSFKVNGKIIRPDGTIIRQDTLKHGYWEAKDKDDDLEKEIKKKFAHGYPKENIIFWSPIRIIIYQNQQLVFDKNIQESDSLVQGLKVFFEYTKPEIENWDQAATEFGNNVKQLAEGLLDLIAKQQKSNKKFAQAFADFTQLCRQAINPNIAIRAIEEMLIQHLLTEKIFRKLFDNPDFVNRNVIAAEIEKVITALTAKAFNRDQFLGNLDYFYKALENAAATVTDYREKQSFLNTVYERFFQGFSVEVADTHGIVYTPQPLVDFMVKSVEAILQSEFNKSLSDRNIHILDPFVGTGNFILRVMQEIKKTALVSKYQEGLHCNEVMLLPYYIASMNIEHEYYQLTGNYLPFEGICLVDTFELAENRQLELQLFNQENAARVERQRNAPIFVIIGNPPYNVGQVNENDNNKNRKYPIIDKSVAETYSKDSKASNKNALSDVYVKALRWASDRIGNNQGIIALVTNNSFIDDISFDGVRKHLEQDFTQIYHINLKGNARTSGERRKREAGNIFDNLIRVSVGVTFFIKTTTETKQPAKIFIYSVDDYLTSQEKKDFLVNADSCQTINFQEIIPNKNHTWLTEGLVDEFETFMSMGNKASKAAKLLDSETIFKNYSLGVRTNRDAWACNFNINCLIDNVQKTIEAYNECVLKWNHRGNQTITVDDFVNHNDQLISWSEGLKNYLKRSININYNKSEQRESIYRPFTKSYLYFNPYLNERRYQFPRFLPTPETEQENRVICVSGIGSNKPFQCLVVSLIPCVDMLDKTQCFPFYVYNEEGTDKLENITNWALKQYQTKYEDTNITKWDIFYYVYGLLHHPEYSQRYTANLRRELPRIPFLVDFWEFVKAGKRLAEIHINYESQPEYPLDFMENPDESLNWQVEKMKLSKDKTQIIYNSFITLSGIPPETFNYRLGNRSALEWIVEQYQVKIDKRSGIKNDPNREDDERYIVTLIGKIITVSLETVEIIKNLPNFELKQS